MPEYGFIEGRCNTFRRSDGLEILLLPEPHCQKCAAPIKPPHVGAGLCYDCYSGDTRVDGVNLSRVYATSVYIARSTGHSLGDEIKRCKHDPSHAKGLAEVLEHAIERMYPNLKSYDLLVHPPRGSKTAKVNHMEHIVSDLSGRVKIPYENPLFKKIDYPSQRGLSKEDRLENVSDKVKCKKDVNGLRVIVVDDTYTTGATMLASAKALRGRGAEDVVGLVLGRTTSIQNLIYTGVMAEIKS